MEPMAIFLAGLRELHGSFYRIAVDTGLAWASLGNWRAGRSSPTLTSIARIFKAYPGEREELLDLLDATIAEYEKHVSKED